VALELQYPPGATPLDPDEAEGLIPPGVTTVAELNAYEAENILAALSWIDRQRQLAVLEDEFVRELHRRMFDRTWRWSGIFRLTEKNIGVAPEKIAVSVHELLLDCREQLKTKAMSLDEIAVRFHHRLVSIHPFANGNGRHSRLMADLLLQQEGANPFSWGAEELEKAGPVRERYIDALREADKKNLKPLLEFVRT
jgi:Fic-DOC domain mobile mystery protein B